MAQSQMTLIPSPIPKDRANVMLLTERWGDVVGVGYTHTHAHIHPLGSAEYIIIG